MDFSIFSTSIFTGIITYVIIQVAAKIFNLIIIPWYQEKFIKGW